MAPIPVVLTSHLTSLSTPRPYSAAVEHAFLASAGSCTVSRGLFSLWLSQDRIYAAHAYPRYIGLLISRIPFDNAPPNSQQRKLNERILKVLSYSLNNVVREVGFFDEMAAKWDLQLYGWMERKGTRDYTAEMARVSTLGDLEDGLIFLWAMERVYLDAWRHVRSLLLKAKPVADVAPLIKSFAENWTQPEFVEFVDELADIVNSLGIQRGSDRWRKAEEVWARVVELEEGFWPEASEEHTAVRGS